MNILIAIIQSFLTSIVRWHTNSNTKKYDNNENKVILSGLEEQKLEKIIVAEDISSVDNNLEEDDGDLNEIKKRIEQSLSNLDQAEVE